MKNQFSVLISTYKNDKPEFLALALDSVSEGQTLTPTEIVIVKDGPVSKEIDWVIERHCKKNVCKNKVIGLQKNVGLGPALQLGISHCSNEIIFRMDADDISVSTRFSEQMSVLKESKADVIGTYVEEFISDPGKITSCRKVPQTSKNILRGSKWRNPINHPSVGFYKSKVIAAGGYKSMLYFEDYYLWLSMLKDGCKMLNLPKCLLKMRAGNSQIGRRHGLKYYRYEMNFFLAAMNDGLLTPTVAFSNIVARFPIRIVPRPMLVVLYSTFLRERQSSKRR